MGRHYLTPTATHQALGLVCLGAGVQSGTLRPTRRRTLDCHALVLVTGGSGQLVWSAEEVAYPIVAPAAFFLRPGVRHSYAPAPTGWQERWVLFDGPAARAYTDLGYLPSEQPVLDLVDPLPARRAFDRLLARCRPDNTDAEVETAALLHWLLLTVPRCRDRAGGDEAVVGALRAAACSTRSIPEHARTLGLTMAGLRTVVRRATGCSPKEYLLQVRLNEAKTLLAESGLPIARVARKVGYDDPAYFSRLFTRRTGSTPRQFRRQQAHGSAAHQ